MTEFLRPVSDDLDGLWTDQAAGTTLFVAIDEGAASDADFIQSADTPSQDIARVKLGQTFGTVDTAQPATVRYRYRGTGVDADALAVRLKEGATLIAEWVHTGVGTSYVTAAQTLTPAEKAAISDWNNLYLEFEAEPVVFDPAAFIQARGNGWNIEPSPSTSYSSVDNSVPAAVGDSIRYQEDTSGLGSPHPFGADASFAPTLELDGSTYVIQTVTGGQSYLRSNSPFTVLNNDTDSISVFARLKMSGSANDIVPLGVLGSGQRLLYLYFRDPPDTDDFTVFAYMDNGAFIVDTALDVFQANVWMDVCAVFTTTSLKVWLNDMTTPILDIPNTDGTLRFDASRQFFFGITQVATETVKFSYNFGCRGELSEAERQDIAAYASAL